MRMSNQAVTEPLPPPSAISPSQVKRFLDSHRGFNTKKLPFSTVEFAAFFRLVTHEAQAQLNLFAQDNLLTCLGQVEGIEAWQLTKDGLAVLGYSFRCHRISKKTLKDITAVLREMQPCLAMYGVSEISYAGRPVHKAQTGKLLIGLKIDPSVSKASTVTTGVDTLMEALNSIPDAASSHLQIVLHDALTPARLATRYELDAKGEKLVRTDPSKVDASEEESEELALWVLGMNHSDCRARPNFWWTDPMAVSSPCRRHFLEQIDEFDLKVRGAVSVLQLTREPALAKESRSLTGSERARMPGYSTDFARLDYLWATGASPQSIRAVQDEVYARHYWDFADKDVLENLTGYWSALRDERLAASAKSCKPIQKVTAWHLAVFDCLNGPKPILVGFVRISGTRSTGYVDLMDAGDRVLASNASALSERLEPLQLRPSYYSFVARAATQEEEAEIGKLNKSRGKSYRSVLIGAHNKGQGRLAASRWNDEKLENLPDCLAQAKPLSLLPRFLYETNGGHHHKFLEASKSLPAAVRERIAYWCINADKFAMLDFVRLAITKPEDRQVQAANLLDDWAFELEGDTWSARSTSNIDLTVVLCGSATELNITLLGLGFQHHQSLLRSKDDGLPTEFDGTLGNLLYYLRQLGSLMSHYLPAELESTESPWNNHGGLPAWFAKCVWEALGPTWLRIDDDAPGLYWANCSL